MTKLEIIKQLNQLSLQINNLIAALSEQSFVDNDSLSLDNWQTQTNELAIILGSELQDETFLFTDEAAEILAGEALIEPVTDLQKTIVDDGEELIFN